MNILSIYWEFMIFYVFQIPGRKTIRPDYSIILDWIKNDSSVLDLGCHDGELLSLIVKEKNARAYGIEIE